MPNTNTIVRLAALCAAAFLLSVSSGVAAQAAFKWWQATDVIKELTLTPDQSKRLEDVWQKALPALKAQKTALDAAEAQFERLIERGDATAMEQINVVEAARAELNKTRATMLWNMRQVLTRDQWAKFTALQQANASKNAASAEKRR
jgi:Spy/CpxP family protein refolding chaperone